MSMEKQLDELNKNLVTILSLLGEKPQPLLLSLEEAREVLNIGANKMRELVKKDSFPKVKNGNKYMVIASELPKWLCEHKGGSI